MLKFKKDFNIPEKYVKILYEKYKNPTYLFKNDEIKILLENNLFKNFFDENKKFDNLLSNLKKFKNKKLKKKRKRRNKIKNQKKIKLNDDSKNLNNNNNIDVIFEGGGGYDSDDFEKKIEDEQIINPERNTSSINDSIKKNNIEGDEKNDLFNLNDQSIIRKKIFFL
jgi:hypothetical protein